ncbi:MAG: single-stranded DNA-binding protein [Croceitalea sp.]|nr:single-stranded DNA-binding protein [Croceitalea sp.]
MNKLILVGRISNVYEMKTFDSGASALNFGVCTSESFKKDGQWTDVPTFHNVKAWNKTAEYISNHIRKGDLVEVEGQIKIDEYEKDGEKKSFTYVNLNRINRLMKAPDKKAQAENGNLLEQDHKPQTAPEYASDSIPF